MSRATEIAEREAAQAEAETPDDDEEEAAEEEAAEGEPEPEPDAGPQTDADMEAIGRKLDGEAKRHANRVREITGQSFGDLVPCPLCVTPGYVLVQPPPEVDPEQRAAVMIALGEQAAPEYRHASYAVMCEECNGIGQVLTGARNAHNALLPCSVCEGKGWKAPQSVPAPAWTPPVAVASTNGGEWTPPGAPPKPEPVYDYANAKWVLPDGA